MRHSIVTCVMPTANRRQFIGASIELFLSQDYPSKELLIIDDGDDSISDAIVISDEVRYIRTERFKTLGEKRNFACSEARGDMILHWDDDDWYAPWRIRYQVEALEANAFDMCGANGVYFFDPSSDEAWEYAYPKRARQWICGATLCFNKSFWAAHPFPNVRVGEDTVFVLSAAGAKIGVLENNRFFVGRIHSQNTSPKRRVGSAWRQVPNQAIDQVLGFNRSEYF